MVGQNVSSKLYGFYHFMSFKTRKEKKVQVCHDTRGPSSLRDSSGVQAMFNSLRFHIYTTVYKEFWSMDYSSIYDFNESTSTPLPN